MFNKSCRQSFNLTIVDFCTRNILLESSLYLDNNNKVSSNILCIFVILLSSIIKFFLFFCFFVLLLFVFAITL